MGALKSRVGHMNGIEKTFRPHFRFRRLKHHRVAVLTNEDGFRQVNALGQTNGLAIAFEDNSHPFHKRSLFRIGAKTKHGNGIRRKSERAPNHCLLLNDLGWALAESGQFEKPEALLEAVINLAPLSPQYPGKRAPSQAVRSSH